ncbi:MAG: OmpA family protein [Deltaproteobacteria bacterium]|nr:OmpA family protein [Deltaproteobacteria bacterium]
MKTALALAALLAASPALGASLLDKAKKAAGKSAGARVEAEVNKQLLAESRKHQCAFLVDSDVLQPGCDAKAARLRDAIAQAKQKLAKVGLQGVKFEVSGHTDSSGNPAHNRELSERRAQVIRRELLRKGVPAEEVVAVGKGSDEPLVKPDDTPAKKARNRRYEIRVRL